MADRQVFVYKGEEYNLPASYTPEQAKARILKHLGQTPDQPAKEAPKEQAPKRNTTWDEDIRLGLTNALTTAGKAAGGVGIAALDALGNEKGAEDLYATLQRGEKNLRNWANPEEAQQGFGGKLLGAVATLPAQVLSMPFSPANTGQEFLQEGESLPRAATAASIDLATNIGGLALGGQVDKFIPKSTLIKKGLNLLGQGAANAVPDYYSKAAIQSVAENEGTKKKFEPNIEDALVSGVTGGGMGMLPTAKSKPNLKKVVTLRAAREQAVAEKAAGAQPPMSEFEAAALPEAQKRQRNAEQAAMFESAIARNEREGQRTAYDNWQDNQTLYGSKDGVVSDALPAERMPVDQAELPLETSPQSISEMQQRGSPQMGMFAPANEQQALSAQAFAKQQAEANAAAQAKAQAAARAGRQDIAQQIIAERQRAMEQEVEQRTALEQNAAQRARQEQAGTGYEEWQANRNVEDATRSADQLGRLNEDPNAQGHLDFNDFGNNDPMARMPNMRVDENGMPIRADLSMEAQNLENPLQMNMWGDELGPALDQQRSLTEAIDSMPPGAERDRGIEMLSGVPKPSSTPAGKRMGPRSQRGDIDLDLLLTLGTGGMYPLGKGLFNLAKSFKDSAVRGSDGKLMPLYHGTGETFREIKSSTEGGALGNGVYMAVRPEYANGYTEGDSPNVHQVYANIKKPLEIRGGGDPMVNAFVALGMDQAKASKIVEKAYEDKGYIYNQLRNLAKSKGYDGLFQYRNNQLSEVVAFDKNQVKSALSGDNPDPLAKPKKQSKARLFTEEEITGDWEAEDANSPQGQPLAPRSQLGGQTMLTDLGLGVYNLVSKGRKALNQTGPKNLLGKDMIPEDVPVETILANAAKEQDSNSWNSLEAGNAMRAAKSRSTWVRDTWDYAQNAIKRSEVNVRNYVTGFDGAEKAARGLSKQERLELAATMKDEMLSRQQYTPEQMSAAGFTTKQLEAYAKIREMQAAALEALNYGRKAQGKTEITPQEAYLTSAWQGEIKMRVLDKDGNLAYYLSGNSERQVKKQFDALKEDFPEFVGGPVERIKQSFNGRDVQTAYSIMADAVGRDSEAFKKVQEWYTQYQTTQAHSAMGTEKHFETKANIRGFVGDRPGADPHAEATALLQSQMNFAKESFHWAALQDAATKMAPIFQDANIRDYHSNNLAYLQEQFRIAAGVNEGSFARGVNDGVRALGFTPAQVFGVAQAAKGWFMFQKLAFNAGYGVANMLQIPYTMPHLLDIGQKFGAFNPARSLAVASALTVPMSGAHYGRQYAGIDLVKGVKDENFYKEMFNYAEQNGVTSRSIVDEAPLDAGLIGRAGNLTTSSPETIIRSFAFTLFADSLKQTGKMNNMEVFKEAERRVNMALGDFRETERAPVFSRLGNVGNILNTLQTYGVNYYQQMNYFLRESLRGNVAPLAAMLAVQYGLAGISGMPGMQDLEKGWEQVKGVLPNSVWAKVGDFDPRIWAYEHFGATGVDGVASTVSGVSLNSRVSAPAGSEMIQAPGGPIIEAAKQIGSAASLAMNPTDPTQQAETAMKLLPTGFTGALETGPFKEQTSVQVGDKRSYFKTSDLHKRDAGYKRTPDEEALRKFGFRSTKEVRERDLSWKMNSLKSETAKRKPGFVDDYYYAVISGNTKKAEDIASNYIKVYGKEIMDDQLKRQIEQTYLTDLERTKSNADKLTPKELIRLRSIRQILETTK